MKLLNICVLIALVGFLSACGGGTAEPNPDNKEQNSTENNASNTEPNHNSDAGGNLNISKTEDVIKEIDQLRQELEGVPAHSSLEFDCMEMGGGTIATWDGPQSLMSAELTHGYEHGHYRSRYYFDENDQLIMAMLEKGSWIGESDDLQQDIYYIKDGGIIGAITRKAHTDTQATPIEKVINSVKFTDMPESEYNEDAAADWNLIRDVLSKNIQDPTEIGNIICAE